MQIHTYIRAYTHTYTHMHTPTHPHTHIYTQTHTQPRWNTVSRLDNSVDMHSIYIPHKYYWEVCNAYAHESGVHKGSPIVQCTVGVCNEEQEQHASKRVCGCVSCHSCSYKITRQACSQGHLSLCLFLTATLLSSAKTASSTSGDLLVTPNI